ncbi:unnamed protein product [Rodentolepis nana]|uniref:Protein kinase domain-containing protein n=1 Tax=Rodentolepis nana TaxID=102285 RepID=A0A0R3TQR8_RODNA|nr:unnamed protein product [Rodentolepis nana]
MSEKASCLSPRLQDKSKALSGTPRRNSSDKLSLNDGMLPISPRESPTPSNSSHHHRRRSSRHHRHDGYVRDRDRRLADRHSPSSNNRNRKRGEDMKETDFELSSERKRHKAYHEVKSEERHSRKDRERTRTKEAKKGHRKHRSYDKERKESRDKRPRRREYADERESRYQYDKEKSVDSLNREHSRSVSRQSSVKPPTSSEEGKNPTQNSTKSSLSPFVVTLLKPLLKEDTSDAELEELLPAGILSGEMAKRSIPLPRPTNQFKRGPALQSHFQPQSHASSLQSQEVKTESSSQEQDATAVGEPSGSKQSLDKNEIRLDKFLSNLSDSLQEKNQQIETWSSGANEVDFSDVLIEEEGTIRMVASAASLRPKQLLEACLSTPWDSLERRTDEDDNDKSEKSHEDKEEDPFDLVSLLSSSISRRYLNDELVKDLEERGISLASTAVKDCLVVADNFKSRMVPGVHEEKAWRQSLLGIFSI